MYRRNDGALTYREYIEDIIPAGPNRSLWRYMVRFKPYLWRRYRDKQNGRHGPSPSGYRPSPV